MSASVATENTNERLTKEIAVLREERDSLLNAGFGTRSTGGSDLERENQKLREQLQSLYIMKNTQHDQVRRLNEQLASVEKENLKIKHEQRQTLLNRLGIDDNDKAAITPEKTPILAKVKTLQRTDTTELPSDEEHRQAIRDIEQDCAENNCQQQ